MKNRSQILSLAAISAVAAALALPAASPAEYYVPPANSAANQYTESFPGAGGESGGKRKDVTPGTALGAGNAKKLESKGRAGKEAAEVAAETAPAQLATGGTDNGGGKAAEPGDSGQTGEKGNGGAEDEGGSGSTGTAGSGGGSPGGKGGGSGTGEGGGKVQQPKGSSGFGQVLGQATGAGDGNLGLWLPLAIVLTLIGSVAYRVRMRHAQAGHRV
jgi:hypothetical protein